MTSPAIVESSITHEHASYGTSSRRHSKASFDSTQSFPLKLYEPSVVHNSPSIGDILSEIYNKRMVKGGRAVTIFRAPTRTHHQLAPEENEADRRGQEGSKAPPPPSTPIIEAEHPAKRNDNAETNTNANGTRREMQQRGVQRTEREWPTRRDSLDSWMNRPATIQNRNAVAIAMLDSLERHTLDSNEHTDQISESVTERMGSHPLQVIRHLWSMLQRGLSRNERTHSTCNGSDDRCRNTSQSEEGPIGSEKSISNRGTDNMTRSLWTRFSRRCRTQSTIESREDVEITQLTHDGQHTTVPEHSAHRLSVVVVSPARTKELLAVGLPTKLRLRLKRAEEQRKREVVASGGDISEPESEEDDDDDDSVRGGCCVFV